MLVGTATYRQKYREDLGKVLLVDKARRLTTSQKTKPSDCFYALLS
jgi:hypothetical protein